MLKSVLVALYQRVIVAYKSTLLGLAIVALSEVANQLQILTNPWARIVAAILGVVLIFLKSQQAAEPEKPVAPV